MNKERIGFLIMKAHGRDSKSIYSPFFISVNLQSNGMLILALDS